MKSLSTYLSSIFCVSTRNPCLIGCCRKKNGGIFAIARVLCCYTTLDIFPPCSPSYFNSIASSSVIRRASSRIERRIVFLSWYDIGEDFAIVVVDTLRKHNEDGLVECRKVEVKGLLLFSLLPFMVFVMCLPTLLSVLEKVMH